MVLRNGKMGRKTYTSGMGIVDRTGIVLLLQRKSQFIFFLGFTEAGI